MINIDCENLGDDLKEFIAKIKDSYSFLSMSEEGFHFIVKDAFMKSKEAYQLNSKLPLNKIFEKVLEIQLDASVKDALENDNINHVLNDFIEPKY